MAKDIVIAGVTYPATPAIDIATPADGTARFYDASGTLPVTENGTYDVTDKASVEVNVPIPQFCQIYDILFSQNITSLATIVTGDDWIREHYNDPYLVCHFHLVELSENASYTQAVWGAVKANYTIVGNGKYGVSHRYYNSTTVGDAFFPYGLSVDCGMTGDIVLTSSGDVKIRGSSGYPVPAGTYMLIFTW